MLTPVKSTGIAMQLACGSIYQFVMCASWGGRSIRQAEMSSRGGQTVRIARDGSGDGVPGRLILVWHDMTKLDK
jgi:hypothetical protein